jgi:hypothetical protein
MMSSSITYIFVLFAATCSGAVEGHSGVRGERTRRAEEQVPVVDLDTAADFAILTKAGISTVPNSTITGDIAVSPIAATAMTGFSLAIDQASGQFSTSTQVVGKAYAADYEVPTPANLTTAVSDMEAAYTDAAGRDNTDAARINLGGGVLGGVFGGATAPLTHGVYTFGTVVSINGDIVFEGTEPEEEEDEDIYIIQMTGNLVQAANYTVILTNGAKAKNIFWQVAGYVSVGAGAHMEGILLVKTAVTFETGSSLNGRILAQTACTLQVANITQPPAN